MEWTLRFVWFNVCHDWTVAAVGPFLMRRRTSCGRLRVQLHEVRVIVPISVILVVLSIGIDTYFLEDRSSRAGIR